MYEPWARTESKPSGASVREESSLMIRLFRMNTLQSYAFFLGPLHSKVRGHVHLEQVHNIQLIFEAYLQSKFLEFSIAFHSCSPSTNSPSWMRHNFKSCTKNSRKNSNTTSYSISILHKASYHAIIVFYVERDWTVWIGLLPLWNYNAFASSIPCLSIAKISTMYWEPVFLMYRSILFHSSPPLFENKCFAP